MGNRQKMVFGNWKMNLNKKEVEILCKELNDGLAIADVKVGVFPSFPYVSQVAENANHFSVGVQNFYPQETGAFTGEVSITQVKDVGAELALIGHSERRSIFNETHAFLKKKVDAALGAGITPVFCCGEPFEVRNANEERSYVLKQLEESLFHLDKKSIQKCVIAYEPVWAIGTGLTATTEQAEDMHSAIRSWIAQQYDQECADSISILYGGSCNASNAKELFSCPNVDGGLIGGASLKSDSFLAIIQSF
jgi:triosephosphate isomerase